MARIHGENTNYTLNSVAIEDELNQVDQEISQQLSDVTAFADTAEEFVQGKYGWTHEVSGSLDPAASQGDATIFALVGSVERAVGFDPTGASAATNDPNYDGNVFLERYSISASVSGPVTYRASLRGNGALARTVS
tara:strand:+ start:158 stop:565 length:408 start_codon:yes stop_codon:yes gene_type:complete